jgi:hypothetical protein
MDNTRFDDLLRNFASGSSRRKALVAMATSLFTAGSLAAFSEDADARKKRKKKKKKCKGGTKKCGKQCIAATACCSSADCGGNGACVDGACDCGAGFKACDGACIPDIDCCGSCPGDTVCEGGDCACPTGAPFACPGGACNEFDECCDASDCSGGLQCFNGACLCAGADDIPCGGACCNPGTEVCDAPSSTCEAGTCASFPNDWCNGSDFYVCAGSDPDACACVSTVDATTACIDFAYPTTPDSCNLCNSSADCDDGFVCINGNDGTGNDFCGCDSDFCVPLCSLDALRSPRERSVNAVSAEDIAARRRGGKRRR